VQIPLVDLEPWFHGDDGARRRLAKEVDAHLQAVGFLLVVNHGVAPDVFADARREMAAFYRLPDAVKEQYRYRGGSYRGWVGLGAESNAGAYGVDAPPDLKETFAVGNPDVADDLRARWPRWFGENVYPAEVPGMKPAVDRFIRESAGLADELLGLLAVSLGATEDTMRAQCRNSIMSASFNWYLPRARLGGPVLDDQYRIGPHTDYGTLTVLDRQPGMGGLEVRVGDEWITAPWVEGALTINTGLLMARWSNDRWAPNEHRVLPPPAEDPDEELISLVLFHDPDADAVIAPLDGCTSPDHPPRYEPVLAGDHLARMMDALAVPSGPANQDNQEGTP
jgi:isopenicillin N synthase-like dioxygenase